MFSLDSLAFGLYGGAQRGTVRVDLSRRAGLHHRNITGLDVESRAHCGDGDAECAARDGRGVGTGDGSGSTAEAIQQGLGGQIRLRLTDGVLKNYPLLARVNQVAGVTGGSGNDTRFESLTGTANIGQGRARVPDLALRAGNLNVTGRVS